MNPLLKGLDFLCQPLCVIVTLDLYISKCLLVYQLSQCQLKSSQKDKTLSKEASRDIFAFENTLFSH